jgi:hypothetical protein
MKNMTPKRLKELRKKYRRRKSREPKTEVIVECLDEIERLRKILDFVVFGKKRRIP